MGANYYHRTNRCDCCGRFDERHICKSGTSFQGYRPDWANDSTPLIVSWEEWKTALRADGEVWDEYGQRHDVEQFIADVEATEPERRRRQYDWMVQHARDYGLSMDRDWLDPDGFSFTLSEFT
jgi:hypothetical protein